MSKDFDPLDYLHRVHCLYYNPKQHQEYSILDWSSLSHAQTEVTGDNSLNMQYEKVIQSYFAFGVI